ncbi:MAG: VOC family protein [Pseudomonadota bacterium]
MKLTFHHLNLTTHDVPGLDCFYADILLQSDVPEMLALPTLDDDALRVPVAFRSDGEVQFHLAEQDLGLALRHGQAINPLERGHIAFRTDDIEEFKRHLDANGVLYSDYGTTFTRYWHQIFFLDPAGTIVEVHQVLGEPADETPLD